ncbi:MAG: polysaccharide deacetylase family protein [Elusimicrobia bacterium]|nr:polysaccharide deacetylase family protein [Elusimicrobiota bacterium]
MESLIIIFSGLLGLGLSARWTWWKQKTAGLPVLVYHKIGHPPKNSKLKSLWVSPENFRKQMTFLLRQGYQTLVFSELLKAAKSESDLPSKSAIVTFDDGYQNNYEHAYKILKDLNAKGNIFLAYNTIGKINLWHNPETEPWINMLTWEQIFEMKESKFMEFGSHTMNHPDLTRIPPEQVKWELIESKKQLEAKLGCEIAAFAYPYGAGAYTPLIRNMVFNAGYVFDFSFKQGKTPWPWKPEKRPIDRLFIRGDENNLDMHLHLTRGMSRLV